MKYSKMASKLSPKASFYKDLPREEELELVLWLGYLEESLDNALTQITRWKRNWNTWDLQMFFVAVGCICEAIEGLRTLGFFAKVEVELWSELKTFRAECEELKIIGSKGVGLRNNIHRDRTFKKVKNLSKIFININGYNVTTDEYTFIDTTVRVSDTFVLVKNLQKNLKKIIDKKLAKYYKGNDHKGMVPFTKLRGFLGNRKYNRRRKVVEIFHN